MKKPVTCFLCFFLILLFSVGVAIAEPTAKEIIEKSKKATEAQSAVNKIQMTLENKRGDTLVQRMVTRTTNEKGLTRSVTTFLYPDETKGTKFLAIENEKRDDDMKIYIPGLRKARTISSAQRNQSYMGTDFAYGDLEGLDPEVGTHTVRGKETVDEAECWVVESTLDPKSGGGYSKIVTWFRADEYIPVKTEYYDKDGQLKKVKTVPELYKDGEVWVLKKMIMKDVQKNHQTIIEVIESKQQPVASDFFTERFLLQTDKY
jgi:uncharacterized protein